MAPLFWDIPILVLKLPANIVPQEKRNGVPMDLRFGEDQDIMTDVGFSNMLYQTLNLRPGGALWAAPVCSSWIYLHIGFKSENFTSVKKGDP